MKNSIAIIGLSFDLPNIKNWKDLQDSLVNKESFITRMPDHRLGEIREAFGIKEMAVGGYINEIDKFDNEYFGITERESLRTFPEHRLFLTNAIKAFYNAGYSETSLKGSKTGIFFNAAESAYPNYASVSDVSFNHFDFVRAIEGTKLAKYLDTRGPVVSIDTSCSSSLVAINAARQSLENNECDLALVGGVKILSLTEEITRTNVVHSQKGECKPFDQEADGMVNGEGAIFFVLKKYDQAVKDGDSILGEIKGIAVNHGGDRISSLTAPSSDAQKEVILQAWKNADIEYSDIKYIEAHGTGTILGDPIEVEGLKQALSTLNPSFHDSDIAMSSFKGQIGHLDYLSGLAGLLRMVVALNSKIIPVQPNFKKLNEFFNLKDTGIYVPANPKEWNSHKENRVGGVSSFGMTGTNVHVVVSKKDCYNEDLYKNKECNYLQISQKNIEKLRSFKKYLSEKISNLNTIDEVKKLCQRLNKVYETNQYNEAIVYTSKEVLIDSLKLDKTKSVYKKIFLLLDLDVLSYSREFIKDIFSENLFIKEQWDIHVSKEIDEIKNQDTLNILFQYSLYKYLINKLGSKVKFITPKKDSILNSLVKSNVTVEELLAKPINVNDWHADFDEDSFKKYLEEKLTSEEIIILDFSKKESFRFDNLNVKLQLIKGSLQDKNRYAIYSNIVELGENPLKVGSNPIYHGIELPHFKSKRFWPSITKNHTTFDKTKIDNIKIDDIKSSIGKVWSFILETEDFTYEDDFFDIGGTSLAALDMIDELEKRFNGVKISYEEMYSYSTVSKLAEKISLQIHQEAKDLTGEQNEEKSLSQNEVKKIIKDVWISILETDAFQDEDDFFDIGGTSLSALDMIDELGKKVKGLNISYEEIYSYSTISKLVQKIIPQTNINLVSENGASKKIDSKLRNKQYKGLIDRIKTESFTKSIPNKILITGGTGLLGKAVIDYLIDNTEADLYCLVRKKDYDVAENRFWSIYGEHKYTKNKDRITVVEGDLYNENLGITHVDQSLEDVEMIFHIAGSPEFISKKSKKDHINFIGTKNIVDWANEHEIKKLSFISTVGVVGSNMPKEVKNFYETDTDLGQQNGKQLIHGASKLEAEKYINNAYKFSSKIFRISNIGGRFEDGHFATDLNKNLMWLRLKSLSKLKYYNEKILDDYSNISFIPVDILSALISEISFVDVNCLKIYHLKSKRPFSNREIFEALRTTGFKPESVSYENFIKYINENSNELSFHSVAQKENYFIFNDSATNQIVSTLQLDHIKSFDRETYLKKLLNANLKPTNIHYDIG
ncbi:beta-ketoacyl synthase N-terminal-like domain-containing protein [Aquimarina gracilis]|uniref:Beta-ketoacyl synthase N-terminal-like domain-containing protein n=1 Tax=Aquimarina gracilis TaxID=874422 RepID=A0ABU5ZSB4_9FLAO|nr:beta-ketoacyl synthase N-terminal-like domain-containing protein [Aquimarina gracilis]MEB3344960.1 beta-ketoacyl synthase N-terminal-like domain-containing protein [Aquimarina gracilis]